MKRAAKLYGSQFPFVALETAYLFYIPILISPFRERNHGPLQQKEEKKWAKKKSAEWPVEIACCGSFLCLFLFCFQKHQIITEAQYGF